MPTELGEPFAIDWRGDPQQMLPPDVPLWHSFLDLYAKDFQRFYYNVKVGGPDMTKIDAEPELKKMFYQANAKRIDAIGEREEEIWIIEVASSPYLRALGQCLAYKLLWMQDPKIMKMAISVLVAYRLDPDMIFVLKHYGVKIVTIQSHTYTLADQKKASQSAS